MEQPSSGGFGPTSSRGEKLGGGERKQQDENNNNSHWNCFQNSVSSQSMIQNYTNFKTSDSPARLMRWSDGKWDELSGDAISEAKFAFSERRPMVEVKLDGNDYIFDFFRMLQIDVGSGLQRSIAWIDVKGDCYFPKFFIDESLIDDGNDDDDDDDNEGFDYACDENPKIEIEIKIHGNNDDSSSGNNRCKRKFTREGKIEAENEDTADSSCNNGEKGDTKRQRLVVPVANDMGTMTWPNARLLGEGERSCSIVRDLFMTGMKKVDSSVRITNIHQFTRNGPLEKARWEAFHKQMEMTEAARGRSNTVFAWHGTSKKGVFDILAHGFGWPSKVSGPQAHGVGVYFAPARLPHLSDMLSEIDDDGEKHLVLCRVILGNIEKVEAGSEQFHPSSTAFDSGADDLVNPKCYIVWSTNMNTHILPECVVTYKSSNGQNGETMGVELLQWIPNGTSSVVAKLFSKLGSLLPAPKVEELKALCMTYKAGKMAKDLFIKQLKFVVGNEMLQSAISDVQGSK